MGKNWDIPPSIIKTATTRLTMRLGRRVSVYIPHTRKERSLICFQIIKVEPIPARATSRAFRPSKASPTGKAENPPFFSSTPLSGDELGMCAFAPDVIQHVSNYLPPLFKRYARAWTGCDERTKCLKSPWWAAEVSAVSQNALVDGNLPCFVSS